MNYPSTVEYLDDQRRKVALVLAKHDGNISYSAHELGISRMECYRVIRRLGLWHAVNSMREKALDKKCTG